MRCVPVTCLKVKKVMDIDESYSLEVIETGPQC
jgi:hypothetical protein